MISNLSLQRGVFNGDEKACKRRDLFATVAPGEEMRSQTVAFSAVLDHGLSYATLSEDGLLKFSETACESLLNYVRKLY